MKDFIELHTMDPVKDSHFLINKHNISYVEPAWTKNKEGETIEYCLIRTITSAEGWTSVKETYAEVKKLIEDGESRSYFSIT